METPSSIIQLGEIKTQTGAEPMECEEENKRKRKADELEEETESPNKRRRVESSSGEQKAVAVNESLPKPEIDKYGFIKNELTEIDWCGEITTDVCKLCRDRYATHVWHLYSKKRMNTIQTCTKCYEAFKDDKCFLSVLKNHRFCS